MLSMICLIVQLTIAFIFVFFMAEGLHKFVKKPGKDAFCILKTAVALLVAFPLILNAIITNHWYFAFPIESSLNEEQWFSFLGSYVGMVGTVICGWVAYRQNAVIQQQQNQFEVQNKQMLSLQDQINRYQVKPNPCFGDLMLELYGEEEQNWSRAEAKEETYYRVFGDKMPDNTGSFIYLSIQVEYMDIIPITEYKIQKIKCKIGNNTYGVDILPTAEDTAFLQGNGMASLQWRDRINLIIKDTDTINGKSAQDFFRAVKIFCNHNSFPQTGYDKGELEFEILFKNQASNSRIYNVHYRMKYKNKVEIEAPVCRILS